MALREPCIIQAVSQNIYILVHFTVALYIAGFVYMDNSSHIAYLRNYFIWSGYCACKAVNMICFPAICPSLVCAIALLAQSIVLDLTFFNAEAKLYT